MPERLNTNIKPGSLNQAYIIPIHPIHPIPYFLKIFNISCNILQNISYICYIAGDTENIPEMAEIKDIDIAFLPCNQPFTMTVEQLVDAARVIKPKVLFPYHYSQTDVSEIPGLLENDGVDVRIRHYE